MGLMNPAPFLIEPDKIGLLVVDMQNDFVREGAALEVPAARKTIPVIKSLIAAFRDAARPVIFLRFIAGPGETFMWRWTPQCGPDQKLCWKNVMKRYDDYPEQLEGAGIIPELAPLKEDEIIDKYGYGGFHNTRLEGVLRSRAVEQLAVTGTTTEVCVEQTVREGFQVGVDMIVIRDGVSTQNEDLHQPALRTLENKFARVEDAQVIVDALGNLALRK